MIIARIFNTAGKLKKLQPHLHRIAVIYFIYMMIRDRREKKAQEKCAP